VTAHRLRHTLATTLLFNGRPRGHIKEIMGHDRLITSCNFYLGVDKRAAKKAHGDFLDSWTMSGTAKLCSRRCLDEDLIDGRTADAAAFPSATPSKKQAPG
jgi:hypothetical protein